MKMILRHLKDFLDKLEAETAQAPKVIKDRIVRIFVISGTLLLLSLIIFIFSLIPVMRIIRNTALIFVIIAIYLLMSLPKYYRCCSNYAAVTGRVENIKKKPFKSMLSMRSFQNVTLSNCTFEGNADSFEAQMEVQIPDTFFIRMPVGQTFTLYYDSGVYTIDHFIAYKKTAIESKKQKT